MSIKIKASAITNLTDARYFAARDVAWMGFSMDMAMAKSLNIMQVKAMLEWVEGPILVAELGLQSLDDIHQIIAQLGLNTVQLSALIPIESSESLHYIREYVIEDMASLDNLLIEGSINQIANTSVLFDFYKNNIKYAQLTQKQISALAALSDKQELILDIAMESNEVADFSKALPKVSLGVRGGEEEKIGYKSFDDVDELLDMIEELNS